MSIINNLKRVAAVVAIEDVNGRNFGELIQNAAIDAINNGIASTEAERYMSLFADNAAQLARLTTDSTDTRTWLRESRAYIMANAVCGTITGTRTHVNVSAEIDDGLPVAPDPDNATRNKRPFPIPNVSLPPLP